MYTFSICIISILLLHTGISLNSEDTDLKNSLSSNYDVVEENYELFGIVEIEKLVVPLIEKICKDESDRLIYIKDEDITITCKDFFNEETNEENLNRVRREADKVEGSGHEEEEVTKIEEEEQTNNATTEKTEENEDKVEVPEIVSAVNITGAKILDVIQEKNTEPPITEETTTEQPETATEQPETTTEQSETTTKAEISTEQTILVEKEKPTEEISENSDKHDPKKDAEVIKGRTLIDAKKNQENKIENHEDNDVQTKESTEPKKAGNKDTTILIFLFVAVVVVGVLAFGYNFIKKKRQQSADLERVERNSIKRSLQNLTKPETGEPEKKPLIGEFKEVEMVDMKKSTEEMKENGASSGEPPVVKS